MTDRIPLDELTSDQLDALYARVERAEAAQTTPALHAQLRAAIEPILDEYPEHNRTDEHEAILTEITTAVLGVVLPAARTTAAIARMSEADVQRVIDVIEQGPPDEHLDPQWERGWDAAMDAIRSALVPSTELRSPVDEALKQYDAETERIEAENEQLSAAYRERAHLVALLAAMTPGAVIAPATDVDEPGWQIAYLTIGDRQASWHIAPRDSDLFEAIAHVPTDHPRAQWDGHTTEEKYEHIAALARQHDAEVRVEVHIQADPTHVADAIRDIRRHGGPPRSR
ncbi:hypothetical protein ACIRJS_32870 [Streptomyces sp. NPDC102340]|uniref:hypothetical protein n=1 Tax=unclassified Streptomyces TaxID=2593676 RepID=UPI0037FFBB96